MSAHPSAARRLYSKRSSTGSGVRSNKQTGSERREAEGHRAMIRVALVLLGVLTTSFVIWLLAGQPHRHGRIWHWNESHIAR